MKVLLSLPLRNPYKRELPEIALGYLASVLRQHGHEVKLLRGMREMPVEEFTATLREFKPQLYGMRFMSTSYRAVMQTARFVKELDPSITIIAGGPHPSGEPVGTLEQIPDLDYAFSGEVETSLPIFVERLYKCGKERLSMEDMSDVPGLVWRRDGRVCVNQRQYIKNLDDIPYPAWDLIDPRTYPHDSSLSAYRRVPVAPIVMTRGCPFLCIFCEPVNGRIVRFRSPGNVVEEMLMLHRDYGVREIEVYDSNCAFRKKFLLEICNRLIDYRVDLPWSCFSGIRLDSLDEELLKAMRRAGCYYVAVGIETGSPEMLKRIKKGITVEQIRKKIAMIHRAGIGVRGYFMLGFPGETREQMQKTIDLAMELPLTSATFSILNPLPGTELYEELKSMGKLEGIDWSTINYTNFQNNYSELTHQELLQLERKTLMRFYLRPKVAFRLARLFSPLSLLRAILRALQLRFPRWLHKRGYNETPATVQ